MNKQDWTYKKLGEVCDIICGQDYKKVQSPNGQYPIYGTGGIMGFANQYRCPANSVIIGRKGSINNPLFIETEFWNVDTAFGIVPSQKYLLSKYFFFFCKSYDFTKHNVAVTIPSLRRIDLLKIPIPIPPMAVQERIVAELDLLSGIIDKKKEQLKAYDQLAQSIFYTMFGDPIDNPKGWETKKLGELATQKLSYGSGASAIQFNGKIRYVRITDIKEDGELNSQIVSPDTFDEKYLLNEGDILFARSGATVGKTFQYKSKFGKCIFAGYLIRMTPNTEIVLPSYIFAYTKSSYYRSFVSMAQNAVAQPNINAKQYSDLLVPLPPLSLQQEFAEKVESIERQKALIRQSIDEVQTMFDYTMDKYFG